MNEDRTRERAAASAVTLVRDPIEGFRHYRLQFPDEDAFNAARAVEAASSDMQASEISHFVSFDVPEGQDLGDRRAAVIARLERNYGAFLVEDYQYAMEDSGDVFDPETFGPDLPDAPSLDDVIRMVRATDAWASADGNGSVIAIVDTGIDGAQPEFPEWKRAGAWQWKGQAPWTDWKGHGTMCATIASATRSDGGRFDGIAPKAKLIACKTRFTDADLTLAYEYLIAFAKTSGQRVVVSNSFGRPAGTAPPSPPAWTTFPQRLTDAIAAGLIIVFSAGNYHELTGGGATACSPESIWLDKTRKDVLTVAGCDLDGRIWDYSSRGPGQWSTEAGCEAKPDVTAPTPANGRILYGDEVRTLPRGWGTSGAAPQVAALAALLWDRQSGIDAAEIRDVIRRTAALLKSEATCCGAGLIDCKAAVDAI